MRSRRRTAGTAERATAAEAPAVVSPAVRRAGAAGAALLVVAVYWPALAGGFVWDDEGYVTNHPRHPLSRVIHAPDGLYKIWCTREAADYWPLTNTAFWVQWRLWGMNPAGYHAVNVALHLLGCLLVWRVLRRLGVPAAWLGGVLLALHPVAVASVAWISELKNCLSLPLYAAAMLWWLRWLEEGNRRWLAAALAAFLSALAAKTSGAALPAAMLGAAWWQRERAKKGTGYFFNKVACPLFRPWRVAMGSVPFFVAAAGMAAATAWFQGTNTFLATEAVRPEGLASRVAAAGWIVWFYLYKAAVPTGLSMVYPRWAVEAGTVTAWLPLAALCAAAGGLWWQRRRAWGRAGLAAMGYVLLALAPVLGLMAMSFHKYSLVSDHFQYLALPATAALAAAGLAWAWRRARAWRAAAGGAGAAIVVALAALTALRANVFSGPELLWRDTAAKNEGAWVAHYNLGTCLLARGDWAGAIDCYRRTIALKPDMPEAYTNLAAAGAELVKLGRFPEAVEPLRTASRAQPDNADILLPLARALAGSGRATEALDPLRKAADLQPKNPAVRNNLGNVLLELGRPEPALAEYTAALAAAPGDAMLHFNRGRALRSLHRLPEALAEFRETLRLQPGHAGAARAAAELEATPGGRGPG